MRENLSKGTLVSLLVGGLLVVPATLPAASGLLLDLELPGPRVPCVGGGNAAAFTVTSPAPTPYDYHSELTARWTPGGPFDPTNDDYGDDGHRWQVWLTAGTDDGDGVHDDAGLANAIIDTGPEMDAGPVLKNFNLPDIGDWRVRHTVLFEDGTLCSQTQVFTTVNGPPLASFDPDQFQDGGFGIAKHHQDTGIHLCATANDVTVGITTDYVAIQPAVLDFFGAGNHYPVVRLNEGSVDLDQPDINDLVIAYELDGVLDANGCADFEAAPPLPTTIAIDNSAGNCFDHVVGGAYTDTDGGVSFDMDVLRYDSTLPITSFSTNPPGPGPFSDPVRVTLHREDDGALNNGIAEADEPVGTSDPPCTHIEYSTVEINGVLQPAFFGEQDATFLVSADGVYTITGESRDYAHNEAAAAPLMFTIDSAAPLVEILEPTAIMGRALVVSAGFNVEISAEASDELSGLEVVNILVDGESLTNYPALGPLANGVFTAEWIAQAPGFHELTVFAQDAAGNAAVERLDVFVVA